jgi:hypothetical protein
MSEEKKRGKTSSKATAEPAEALQQESSLDVSLEWIAEPIIKGVYKYLEWKEIQTLSEVCRGWKAAATGEVGDEPEYLAKYTKAYPNRENKVCSMSLVCWINGFVQNNSFYKWRADRTVNAFEQSFLVLLESQMLLVRKVSKAVLK